MKLPKRSAPLAAFSLIGTAMTLGIWLTLGLRFDRETSPAWHFTPYLTMPACPLAGISVTGMFPLLRQRHRQHGQGPEPQSEGHPAVALPQPTSTEGPSPAGSWKLPPGTSLGKTEKGAAPVRKGGPLLRLWT